jgi:putative peptide zinc metalloprotease protein
MQTDPPHIENVNHSGQVLLRLRPELRASLHECSGEAYYLLEDPVNARFFRVGTLEWNFAARLDGLTTAAAALQAVNRQHGREALSVETAQAICRWLIANGLIEDVSGAARVAPAQPGVLGIGLSLFVSRIPLWHPDRFLARLAPKVEWVFSWPVFLGWLALVGYGGYCVLADYQRFRHSAAAYLAPQTWVFLWGVWLCLKLVHELFHGLACKHYGGNVGSAGIVFILFSPVAFVDVTSAWRFRSRWQRIMTSAAGMYVEFAIAAVAAICWSRTDSGFWNYACHSIVITASLTTLIFNANPLMRFDGYYILADLLEIQNLYGEGRQYCRQLLRRWYLGLDERFKLRGGAKGLAVRVYGLASAFWRLVVSISLVLGAATLFHGAGLALAALGLICWFALPLFRFAKYLLWVRVPPAGRDPAAPTSAINPQRPSRIRFALAMTVTAAIALAILLLPVPGGVSAPAVVEYAPLQTVRAEADGFVEEVLVRAGDRVEENQVLMVMRNDQLQSDLAMVHLEREQSAINARMLHGNGNVPAYQAELEHGAALEEKEAHVAHQVAGLVIRAPCAGSVISSGLENLVGRYFETGSPLVIIGSEEQKEVQLSIPEQFVESFVERVGRDTTVWIDGHGRPLPGACLAGVEPSAQDVLRHEALGAHNHGPLPVRPVDEDGAMTGEQFRLIAPRFHAVISLPPTTASSIRAGQLGVARFTDTRETIGQKTYRTITNWLKTRLTPRES